MSLKPQVPPREVTLTSQTSRSPERFAALDGIRAFAVMAVLLYHFGISWLGGGLLGVDVFFVLSGFLITSLLCREFAGTQTIRLGHFWANRARRLLPALFVLILGIAAYVRLFAGSVDVSSIRSDAIATLLYGANWHFVLSAQGYFAQAAAPSPLLHTWSLAVEEQYYLIWPLIALVVAKRWGTRAIALTAGVGAAGSALLMACLFAAGVSIDRLYYGTDTRAQALLVGSFLGAVGAQHGNQFEIIPAIWRDKGHRWWTTLGLVGAASLIWMWHTLDGQSAFLYRGGFLLVALAAGAVIVSCVTCPNSLLPRLLSVRALVFTGRISYGLYLYHWPLYLAISHAHTGLIGPSLLAVRLAATFTVASLSFRYLEEPIRRGQFFRGRKGLVGSGIAAVATTTILFAATVAPAVAAAPSYSGDALSATERSQLASRSAFTSNPLRFLMVGDSIALTLGVGLNAQSIHRFGVKVFDGGFLGCDLDNVPVSLGGQVVPTTSACIHWRTIFPAAIDRFHPNVVGVLLGRWQISDHLYKGHWVRVGDQSWDLHLIAELDDLVRILAAGGARVVLFTMPFIQLPEEAPNGTPFSETDPARVVAFNRLLVNVADHNRGTVTLIDLNKLLDPSGHYQSVVNGVTVRWTDGVHITVAGGEWLQPLILSEVVRLGLATRPVSANGRSGN
jgi:peptidoglycan/LPS O-acetylase OafA/YrhL